MTWWLYSKQIQIPGHSWPTCDMGIDSKGTVNVTLSVYSTWTYMYILYSICVQSLVGRNCLQSKGIMCWYHQYNYLWLGLVHATLSFVKTPGIDSLEGFCKQIYHLGKPYHTFAVCLFHIACQLHSTWHGWGISRLMPNHVLNKVHARKIQIKVIYIEGIFIVQPYILRLSLPSRYSHCWMKIRKVLTRDDSETTVGVSITFNAHQKIRPWNLITGDQLVRFQNGPYVSSTYKRENPNTNTIRLHNVPLESRNIFWVWCNVLWACCICLCWPDIYREDLDHWKKQMWSHCPEMVTMLFSFSQPGCCQFHLSQAAKCAFQAAESIGHFHL